MRRTPRVGKILRQFWYSSTFRRLVSVKQVSKIKAPEAAVEERTNFLNFTPQLSAGVKALSHLWFSVLKCILGPYVLQDWNLTEKLSVHLFEVVGWITPASLHRPCVLSWMMWCVCVRGPLSAFPFFSYNGLYCQGQRKASSAPGFHHTPSQCVFFVPGCSSLSLSSPLNYCVCAQSGVTLNPGFNLLTDRRRREHVCHLDIWQAATPLGGGGV